jgi:prolyl-tRNA synthetase
MRQSHLFGRTLRAAPADAQLASHKLLLRAACARQVAAGIWTLEPLGFRVARKLEQIIREEIDRIGGQEMSMPVMTPATLWQESGRWDTLEPNAFRFRDHDGRDFMIAFTHEEVVAAHAREDIVSYRQLPMIVYHFQTKGRDEARPRGGLVRVREFVMKDSYSIDRDFAGLDAAYEKHRNAYTRIFKRAGVNALIVESDPGNMGGDVAHEFQVLVDGGEDRILICENGDYRANADKATRKIEHTGSPNGVPKAARVATPGASTIEQVSAFMKEPASRFLKTVLLKVDGRVTAVVLPGDRDLNEAKLKARLGAKSIRFAAEPDFAQVGGVAGFVGPVGLRDARVVVDAGVSRGAPYIAGANVKDTHLQDVVFGRDFEGEVVDVHDAREGDRCPRCGGKLELRRGIEVGNIFKLGTFYTEKLNAMYLDEDGSRKPLVMGSYGIGVGRLLATVVEEHHDEKGIIWPMQVAPYHVHLVTLPQTDERVRVAADRLYEALGQAGVEVLYDDRDETAGVKFADADLIGLPIRVTVSKRTVEKNEAEIKLRDKDHASNVPLDRAVAEVKYIVDARLAEANA